MTFLKENADGYRIKELTLLPMDNENYKVLIPFISLLRSIARLELRGSILDSFIYELLEDTSRAASDSNSDPIMFPLLSTLVIVDYGGDGMAVQQLVETRLALHTSLRDTLPSVSRMEKVEWNNCKNVLPAIRWRIARLCEG
jgi:hypothetical protein